MKIFRFVIRIVLYSILLLCPISFSYFLRSPFFYFSSARLKYLRCDDVTVIFRRAVYIKISCRIQSNDIWRSVFEISHREFEHHLSDRLPSMTSTYVIARVRAYRSSPQIDRQAGRVGGRCWRT